MSADRAPRQRTPWAGRAGVDLAMAGPRALLDRGTRIWQTGRAVAAAIEGIPALLDRVNLLVTSAEIVVVHVDAVTSAAQDVAVRVDETQLLARAIATRVDTLQRRIGRLVDAIDPLLASAQQIDPTLVTALSGIAEQLQPLLSALTRLDSSVPQTASSLLTKSAPLVDQIETVILPLLRDMLAAVPDVRGILPVVQRLEPVMVDVETRIAGLPGASLLRKRGEREIDEATAEPAE